MIAENLRAWLIGTHHGVTAKWLPFYLAEFASRAWRDPTVVLTRVVNQISRAL